MPNNPTAMPNNPTVLRRNWTLCGTGRRLHADWPDFTRVFPGATAVWADLDGMHRGVLPATLPPATTHLWFWTSEFAGRVRIDGSWWAGGVLVADRASRPPGCQVIETGLVVAVTQLRPLPKDWGPTRQRRGDPAAWQALVQLVPQRARMAVFLMDPVAVDSQV